MRTLLDDRFAPVTSSIGFLRASLDDSAQALQEWRQRLFGAAVTTRPLNASLPNCLSLLEPLTGGARPRELLVDASGPWTAYFDCSLNGTDAVSTIGYLSEAMGCFGLGVRTIPHMFGLPTVKGGRMGSVQFEVFAPYATHFINHLRSVALTFDGRRWVFDEAGEVQPYEETDRYKRRRVGERFTSEMVERYCAALGLAVFDATAYGPRAMLIESPQRVPSEGYVMSLREVQRWLGVLAGRAHELPPA